MLVYLLIQPSSTCNSNGSGYNVICGLVIINTREIRIESLPLSVFSYSGESDINVNKGFGRLSVLINDKSVTGYKLDYNISEDGFSYAGLSFQFLEPQDLTRYNYIELTINFGDNESRCSFFMEDITNKQHGINIGRDIIMTNDITVRSNGENQIIRIPIRQFNSINQERVNQIGFNVTSDISRVRIILLSAIYHFNRIIKKQIT